MSGLWANKPEKHIDNQIENSVASAFSKSLKAMGTSYDNCIKNLMGTVQMFPSTPNTEANWAYCKVRFICIDGNFYPEFLDEVNDFIYEPTIFHDPYGDRIVYRRFHNHGSQ